MKKKTLVILLIIPFVIALLTFVSVVALTNTVASDIAGLRILNYRENEGFKVNGEYKLEAEISYSSQVDALLKPGADTLVWSLENKSEGFNDDVATIIEKDGEYYLKTGSQEGTCTLLCSNESKTKSDSITAHIYKNGLVLINPVNQSSGSQIDPIRYYGEYDISYDEDLSSSSLTKSLAKIPLDIEVISDNGSNNYVVSEISDNISFDKDNETINILKEGEASLTLTIETESYIFVTYSFEVVNEGVNVYSFNDLMMCTNKSQNGEIVVMQVNLESRDNALNKDENGNYLDSYKYENTKLFGNYDFRSESFNFNDFIYYQKPKLETKFIDQFLEKVQNTSGYDYQTEIKIGVRVQKDFYGNGFTINMHELAYPVHGSLDSTTGIFTPDREKDYFFGPLTFVSIGDLEQIPIIRAYLCDNAGLMIEGNDLTLNDIKLQNSNNVDNMFNLRFTGTVLEIEGNNVVVQNSVIQNGRTCIRAFSSDGLLIDNCLLQNAAEFIVKLGSNKINSTNHNKQVNVNYNNQVLTKSFDEFFNGSAEEEDSANYILSDFITKTFSASEMDSVMNTINEIQNGLDDSGGILNEDGTFNYDAHIKINDTYFYNSGIYSIALESSFNGPYLYSGMPSQLTQIFELLSGSGFNIVMPNDIGGTSYPVELILSGDTRFYDWKNIDQIDLGALIEENIKAMVGSIAGSLGPEVAEILENLTIDDYFPLKDMIKDYVNQNNLVYKVINEDNVEYYINRPVAWYGGGYNASTLINEIEESEYNDFSSAFDVDFARSIFSNAIYGLSTENIENIFKTVVNLLSRCVVMATGSHPFRFITNGTIENNEKPSYFDDVPSYLDLVL